MAPLYGAMSIFIQHPWLAAVIGVVLLLLGTDVKRGTPIVAGVLWLLYGGYEAGIKLRWFCTGECNIRVDLLLFYPVLLVMLISAVVSLARAKRNTTQRRR